MFEHSLGRSDRNAVTEFFDYILRYFLCMFGYHFEFKRVFRSVHYEIARFRRRVCIYERKKNGKSVVSVNKERYCEYHAVYGEYHRSDALVRILFLYHRADYISSAR